MIGLLGTGVVVVLSATLVGEGVRESWGEADEECEEGSRWEFDVCLSGPPTPAAVSRVRVSIGDAALLPLGVVRFFSRALNSVEESRRYGLNRVVALNGCAEPFVGVGRGVLLTHSVRSTAASERGCGWVFSWVGEVW